MVIANSAANKEWLTEAVGCYDGQNEAKATEWRCESEIKGGSLLIL